MQDAPFAQRIAAAFRQPDAPAIETRDGGPSIVAVELRRDTPGFGMTGPIASEAAWLLCLHLRDVDRFERWEDDRSRGIHAARAGTGTLHDLRRTPVLCTDAPFHILALCLPDAAPCNTLADPAAPRASGPDPIDDRVLASLARSLLPFLDGSAAPNPACTDHALRAIAAQAATAHAVARHPVPTSAHRGGLAPWQQRRAQALLRDNLANGISLDAVAHACSLSPSGFLRAFRQSVGIPPHQWLLRCRVDRATELMRDRHLTLSQIALSAGFCDQSHFTRAFSRRMGLSPGAWRRAIRAETFDDATSMSNPVTRSPDH